MSAAATSANGQSAPLRLLFDAGTLVVEGPVGREDPNLPGVKFDPRTAAVPRPSDLLSLHRRAASP